MSTRETAPEHRGPSLLFLGTVYLVLFMAGVIVAARMASGTYVSPFASEDSILEFFRLTPTL